VLFTDLASSRGLLLPELRPETQARISERIRAINTSTRNPVDLGAYGVDFRIMAHTMRAMDDDDGLDVIIPFFSLDFSSVLPDEVTIQGMELIAQEASQMHKPVAVILGKAVEDEVRLEKLRIKSFARLRDAGLPVYPTFQDAINAVASLLPGHSGAA